MSEKRAKQRRRMFEDVLKDAYPALKKDMRARKRSYLQTFKQLQKDGYKYSNPLKEVV